jgi:CheY-like chemotaxis protein
MHDGTVEASSDGPGRGTQITIRVPVSGAASGVKAATPAKAVVVNRRVLVVDDNEDAARTLAMLVTRLGGESRVANDGASGLAALTEFQPEIVMLDIGMSGIDGYETCRRMRLSAPRSDLLIVALTGWGQETDKQRAREAGFDVHLTKPADPVALSTLLAKGRV